MKNLRSRRDEIIRQSLVCRHDCDRRAVEFGAPPGRTLRNCIEAMGEFDIFGRFQSGIVRISTLARSMIFF